MRKLYELGKNPLKGFDDLEDYMWAIGRGAKIQYFTKQFKCPWGKILFKKDEHGFNIDFTNGMICWEEEISDLTHYVKKAKKLHGTPIAVVLCMLDDVDDVCHVRCFMFSNQLENGLEIQINTKKRDNPIHMEDFKYYEDTDIIFDELLEALGIE